MEGWAGDMEGELEGNVVGRPGEVEEGRRVGRRRCFDGGRCVSLSQLRCRH